MTCKQLGGACDAPFHAETFEEIAELSKQHGLDMYRKSDPDHMQAMEDMREKMSDPQAMQEWMEERRKEFDALPEEK